MGQEVKIVYCMDTNKKPVFYQACEKGKEYFCLECKEPLVVRDGEVNVKHLAHKSETRCRATGEHILNRRCAQNIAAPGMLIKVGEEAHEVYEVLYNVDLSKQYGVTTSPKLTTDVLLKTSGGDVPISIVRDTPIKWKQIMPRYDELFDKYLEGYEVSARRYLNDTMTWKSFKQIRYELENATSIKTDKEYASCLSKIDKLKSAQTANKYNCYFNYMSRPVMHGEKFAVVPCALEISYNKYIPVLLQMDTSNKFMPETRIRKNFAVASKISKGQFFVYGKPREMNVLCVESFYDIAPTSQYSPLLYRKICTAAENMPFVTGLPVAPPQMDVVLPEWDDNLNRGYLIPDSILNIYEPE